MRLKQKTYMVGVTSSKKFPLALSPLSAGDPAEVTDDYELLDVNELITGGREGILAFRVTGDSMLEYIKPGYIVFVDPYAEPKTGDVVATSVNGRNNVKIIEKKQNNLYLVSANQKYEPQKITPMDDFKILGVVRAHLAVY